MGSCALGEGSWYLGRAASILGTQSAKSRYVHESQPPIGLDAVLKFQTLAMFRAGSEPS